MTNFAGLLSAVQTIFNTNMNKIYYNLDEIIFPQFENILDEEFFKNFCENNDENFKEISNDEKEHYLGVACQYMQDRFCSEFTYEKLTKKDIEKNQFVLQHNQKYNIYAAFYYAAEGYSVDTSKLYLDKDANLHNYKNVLNLINGLEESGKSIKLVNN